MVAQRWLPWSTYGCLRVLLYADKHCTVTYNLDFYMITPSDQTSQTYIATYQNYTADSDNPKH